MPSFFFDINRLKHTFHNHSRLHQTPKIFEKGIPLSLLVMTSEPKDQKVKLFRLPCMIIQLTIHICDTNENNLQSSRTTTGICSTKKGRSFNRTALRVALAFWPPWAPPWPTIWKLEKVRKSPSSDKNH